MKQLTKDIINDISLETGIAPSYIEKDWYLILVLKIIISLNSNDVKVVFAGGTSLSKGYGYIKRFSEDIDFSVVGLDTASRNARSKYKDDLIKAINDTEDLKVEMDSVHSRDESRFTNFYIDYPKSFDLDSSLRNNLKMELSFKTTFLPTEKRIIKSFIGEYLEDCPIVEIDCISCIETAANKFNALMWRVDIKNRAEPYNHMTNDPALMRHLHDLSALSPILHKSKEFKQLVAQIYELDKKRGDKTRDLSLSDLFNLTVSKLKTDSLYKKEYDQFVSTMSYATDNVITFETALSNFEKLKECL